jgi:hypothetical protein
MTVIPSQGAFYVLTGQARSLQKVTPPERAATVIASELPWLWSWTLAEGDALYAITDKKDIVRQPLAGGPLETLATPEDGPAELVVAGGFLYWVGSGLRDNSWNVQPGTGSVMRRALAGGTPEPVAVGEDRPTGLRADERAVYWFSKTGDTAMLRSAPLAGGPARTLATGLYAPRSIRFSGNDLFFIEDYNILRISRDGGPLSSVGHTIFPSALTVDETHVYWSELTQVLRARKDRTLEPARPLAP